MSYIIVEKLTPDVRRHHLLRAFEAMPEPVSYTRVKETVEFVARHFNRADFDKGLLRLDPVFRAAIDSHDIKHVQGGYVLTDGGRQQIEQIHERLVRKFG